MLHIYIIWLVIPLVGKHLIPLIFCPPKKISLRETIKCFYMLQKNDYDNIYGLGVVRVQD